MSTPVSVTVAGQTLTTTVGPDGLWAVVAATLAETSHTVVASVTSGGGTAETATQVLRVDVTAPVLTIVGGTTRSTTDTSPWTRGTTTEPADTIVHVTVHGQQLFATVAPGGTWGVSADTLAIGTYNVVATITDVAGNSGSATQALDVVDGRAGARRDHRRWCEPVHQRHDPDDLRARPTPPLGTSVAVTVNGQTLTTTVEGRRSLGRRPPHPARGLSHRGRLRHRRRHHGHCQPRC